ncbi:hypothetical protein [Leptospira santarosai]|uniref:hypothetical protein n=1 Tax=Leptospira santarosai TaxID=28183 RepID=UPI0002F244AF|nr:hypothetical protein [Leptospira santarosai]MDI7189143.1 hypothetical protein [Leptospira santarosai]MDI7209056.1 hypothetical protein [Leptospira santarosai]MDI7213212.1 hypothetical protein [Leptospira santarosai]MDI7220398.1 hypothetical protein [Leptospira santarosai]
MNFKRIKTGIVSVLLLLSCGVKPEMTYESVKQGNDLERIPTVSLKEFFQAWRRNRRHPKMFGINFQKLFEDEKFRYFGRHGEFGLLNPTLLFFKIEKEILENEFPGYEDVFRADLEGYFWNQILPKMHRNLWLHHDKKNKERCRPKYQYFLENKKVILTMRWEIEDCKDLVFLQDKSYRLVYDLVKKKYE